MDNLILIFFSSAFVFATLGISAVTFVIRKVAEWFLDKPWFPGSKVSDIWGKLILPILPIIVGGLAGYFFSGFPYPEGFSTNASGRTVYAMVAGLLSTTCFRVFKDFLLSKLPKQIPDEVKNKIDEGMDKIEPVPDTDRDPPQLS